MKYLAVAIALPFILIIVAMAYFMTPSVFVARSARGATVHCELLGDYACNVGRIDIIDMKSGRSVWRAKAMGEPFQLRQFEVVAGPNDGMIQPHAGRFYLEKGIRYRVSVCPSDWLQRCRNAEFLL